MNSVYIGLGSNLGNREDNIHQAIALLSDHPDIEIHKLSSLIETKADGHYAQPNFLNGAMEVSTFLTPNELLDLIHVIEKQLGRQSKGDMAPRPIDLDILFYNDEIIITENLTIPHPLIHERYFVLAPLNELCPEFKHPLLEKSIQELFEELS